jgi:N-formylglutamate deformylase
MCTLLKSIENVLSVTAPVSEWIPVVLDSPHSGCNYPQDFDVAVQMEVLRTGEDTFVDQLFPGPVNGALMVAAEFPRTYIDPNRPLSDLDVGMLDGAWPDSVMPSDKSAVGNGLVWTSCNNGDAIYARALQVAEVRNRIDTYWRPYRSTLQTALDAAYERAGAVWHINCHSMPSLWPAGVVGAGTPVAADFLLGSRDGSSCDNAMIELVARTLEKAGFRVAINDRFKGVDIVRCSGDPANARHSLQIEVVRTRYMDENTFMRSAGFASIQDVLGDVVRALGQHARTRVSW